MHPRRLFSLAEHLERLSKDGDPLEVLAMATAPRAVARRLITSRCSRRWWFRRSIKRPRSDRHKGPISSHSAYDKSSRPVTARRRAASNQNSARLGIHFCQHGLDPKFIPLKVFQTMDNRKIGIVSVTYNSSLFIDQFIDSVQKQNYDNFHTYIIDNYSQDDTVDKLKHRCSEPSLFTVIENSNNVGIAAGNNQGIFMALEDGCEWVLLLNNDTIFHDDFLHKMKSECIQRNLLVGVPKIYFDYPERHIWYGGGGFKSTRGHTGYHTGFGELDRGQCDAAGFVDYSPTCAMLVHRSVFYESDLMDETYFVYFDDTDFCWRLRKIGISIGYIPIASLVHKVGGSTGGTTSLFTCAITARNRVYFIRKHISLVAAIAWASIFISYYFIRYALRGDLHRFNLSIRSTFQSFRLVPKVPRVPRMAKDV